jgi:uncharacterized protein (DUF983 family)
MAVVLTANVDCEACGEVYSGRWEDDSDTVEDMAEQPVAVQKCPACGHEQQEEYPGWGFRSEAG